MAIKPFAIQGSDLTLGGVNLQAGATQIVIPGVTQAVNYFVEEVDERDSTNPNVFGSDATAITVIDNSRWLAVTTGNNAPSASYVPAEYSVDELDDGQIEEINVEVQGLFAAADKTRAEAANMWATLDPTPFTTFNSANWTQIPFRPKIRAGEVENIGGGGSNYTLPTATTSVLGGVKVDGTTITINDGVITAVGGGSSGDANIWVQTFVTDIPTTDFPQIATSVEYDADGNVIALFSHTQTGGVGPDSRYYSVGKYTPSGSKIWTVRFAVGLDTDGWGLAVDSVDNWIYIAGSTGGGDYTYNVSTLTKIGGGTGSIEWSKIYDFGFESSSAVVDVDSTGNPVMVGYADDAGNESYLTVTKIDKTNGNVTWTRKLDGQTNEQAYGMAVGPTGEIVAVGTVDNLNYPEPYRTIVTLTATPASDPDWTTDILGATQGGLTYDVTFAGGVPTFSNIVDTDGNRYEGDLLVTFNASQLGPTGSTNMQVRVGTTTGEDMSDRMLIVKYAANGTIAWQKAVQFDADYNCSGADADIDSNGNIYICGQFNIDGGGGDTGIALVKFNSSGVKQWSRRVVGNCVSTATSIVVGPDDKLYISGVNGDEIAETFTWVVAKYSLDGLVEWQRFIENTDSWTFAGDFFGPESGGSNIAVRQGYVALAGGFGSVVFDQQAYAAVLQVPDTGNVFAVGSWDFKAATLSGLLDATASDIGVVDADLTDSNNALTVSPDSATPQTDNSNFLIGTLYTAPGISDNELTNGEHVFALESDGTLTLDGEPFSPTASNTNKGFINIVGDRPNNDDDAWFESVVVHGGYAYVLGGDYYIDNSDDRSKVYKFNLTTGEQVWVKQICAGRGAVIDLIIGSGVVTIDNIGTGTGYKVGEEIVIEGWQLPGGSSPANNVTIIVNTINGSGGILTASVKSGYNVTGLTGTFSGISFTDDARGDVCSIAYDEFNDKLIVVSEYRSGNGDTSDNSWQWANVYTMDPTTGAINQTTTLSDEGDIYPNSIATFNASGKIAVVGEKYNEYRELGTLTMLATGNGYFDILKSELDADHYPGSPYDNYSDFWITGTGIAVQENVDNYNEYTGLASTVQQGSGAVFTIADNGDGTYGVSAPTTAGTNYRVGHKIKVLGTAIGGATPANDCVVIVNEINPATGAITILGNATGTAVGSTYTLYNSVTGTNIDVGSGATFVLYINATTGAFNYGGYSNGGSNYVAGDVLTVAGTAFAGGTSPANNATIVVGTVDGSGGITSVVNGEATGTGPTTAIRIRVDGVDFTTVGGSWSMRQNLQGEAFIWTPDWSNAIGGSTNDRFYDVTWSNDGAALYAVGRGRYEVNYNQALVVKFDATDGSIEWSKDIKFSEATTSDRQARAVCLVPDSNDIIVGGEWSGENDDEIILTRITDAGVAVWQKTYEMEAEGNTRGLDAEISLKVSGNNIILSFEQNTYNNSRGLAYMVINPADGTVIRHRVVSSDNNSNYNNYNTPTANWADVYSDTHGDYVVMTGHTYVPTDNYYNALLMKLPLDGLVDIAIDERWSLGEHIMNRHTVNVTTMTSAFESFTADEHIDTITNTLNARTYTVRAPDGNLVVWTHTITDDSAGYVEFGNGSRQSFATHIIPQIRAANDYWLTDQDSGKHIFFEHETGSVYIPHTSVRYFPVGFTFTIVNTTGGSCYVNTQSGDWERAIFKLAGRNITTPLIGIPDSGSGSMVTVMKIKDGYSMTNSDNDGDYPDIWMVSGPGDVYDDF